MSQPLGWSQAQRVSSDRFYVGPSDNMRRHVGRQRLLAGYAKKGWLLGRGKDRRSILE